MVERERESERCSENNFEPNTREVDARERERANVAVKHTLSQTQERQMVERE